MKLALPEAPEMDAAASSGLRLNAAEEAMLAKLFCTEATSCR
ncbi:hypothetical protein [Undibacter mobilis]|nr:hypothetical protein [Undibacter mobilis]